MNLTNDVFIAMARASCAFANLKRITGARCVERLFPWILKPGLKKLPVAKQVAVYTAEQGLLQKTLQAFTADSLPDAEVLRTALTDAKTGKLEHHFMIPTLVLGGGGFDYQLRKQSVPGVKTSWLLVINELLTRTDKRYIELCNLNTCNNLVFGYKEDFSRRPSFHCCDDHREACARGGDELRRRSAKYKKDPTRDRVVNKPRKKR